MITACIFPGQGSQRKGMGLGLFERFKEQVATANEILGYSIENLCLEDPNNQLNQTAYTQPALYIVNALHYRERQLSGAPPPAYLAGHSLGEYNALLAAQCFDFQTGLKIVIERGAMMSKITGGAMAAVIGLNEEKIIAAIKSAGMTTIDLANYNSPNQIVVSGMQADIEAIIPILTEAGARMVMPLKVSGAFHSRYMADVSHKFNAFLSSFTFHPPQIPVIANSTALPYPDAEIKEVLARQICHPVLWTDSMRYMMNSGVEDIIEVGPGNILTGLLRQIKSAC